MTGHLETYLASAIGLGVGFVLGARHGFRRGFSSRMAGSIPPAYTRSRPLMKAFARGLAKGARRAHLAEIKRVKTIAQAPAWRRALERVLFP